jgi:glycosyltransferase involved in cell wall biosynthesis
MKIIIIGPAHPLRGGLATLNARLAEVLQEHGHEVIIYSFSLQYPSVLFPGKSQFTDEPAPAGLKIKSVINSVNPLNWIVQGNKLRDERADLVIVRFWLPFMGPSLGTILRRVKRNRHSYIISIADNVIPHEKRFGDTAFTRYFLKPVDAFLTMSREVLQDLRTFSNKPALYTPHPLYDNFGAAPGKAEALQKLGLNPQDRHLLFFGFIRKYKGLDLLLEAMADERVRALQLKLIIAGEYYSDETLYTGLIETYRLQQTVRLFTDFIPNDEVPLYFAAADLIAQPYRAATQSGITQIAYHFEKPMIVTNVGGLAENVPNGKVGFVAEPTAASIAAAILRFFSGDPIPDLEQNIREEKKKYSWDTFIGNILSLKGKTVAPGHD